MLVKEIKPNTAYATCDGEMLVTGDVVKNGYFDYRYQRQVEREDGSVAFESVHVREHGDPRKAPPSDAAGRPDPWAKCSTGRGVNMHGLRINAGPGLLVTQFDYDGEGKRIEEKSVERVVAARDLVGTWAEYMLLHADDVVVRWKRRRLLEEQRDYSQRIIKALAKAGIEDGVLFPGYCDPDKHQDRTVEVRAHTQFLYADGSHSTWEQRNKRISDARTTAEISLTGPAVEALLNILDGRTASGRKRKAAK